MAAPQVLQAPIARVYADSLYALAAETDREDEVMEELETLGVALDADPMRTEFFGSPLVDDETKRDVVERVLRGKASDLVVDTLQVMRRKGRLGLTRALIRAYRELWMKRRNQVEARVASAVATLRLLFPATVVMPRISSSGQFSVKNNVIASSCGGNAKSVSKMIFCRC